MRILIVDDNSHKAGRLEEVLKKAISGEAYQIERAVDLVTARKALRETSYDLLVLDIALPNRIGETPRETGGSELLHELMEREVLHRPQFIVGFTQYPELFDRAVHDFSDYLWSIQQYSDDSDQWVAPIQRIVRHLEAVATAQGAEYKTDFGILCALPRPELRAVLDLPWNWARTVTGTDAFEYFEAEPTTRSGERFSVVASASPRMGLVAAALQANNLVRQYRPRMILMAGVCAGVKEQTRIGDVILADMSWMYESGKHNSGQFEVEPHQVHIDPRIRRTLLSREENTSIDLDTLWRKWTGNDKPETPPRYLVGAIASGSGVVKDEELSDKVKEQFRKLLGIDMETYAVFCAAFESPAPAPLFLSIKVVCDLADRDKSDKYQAYCSYISAHIVRTFAEDFIQHLRKMRP